MCMSVGDLTSALNAHPRRSPNIRYAEMTIVLAQAELADPHLVGHAGSAVPGAH
jgi:hypothetical protein